MINLDNLIENELKMQTQRFEQKQQEIINNSLQEKDKEIERLKNGCKKLEQQVDDLYKLETTLTNENERLNNIIDELEKELREGSFDVYFCSTTSQKTFKSNEIIIKAMILDKLKELKESK